MLELLGRLFDPSWKTNLPEECMKKLAVTPISIKLRAGAVACSQMSEAWNYLEEEGDFSQLSWACKTRKFITDDVLQGEPMNVRETNIDFGIWTKSSNRVVQEWHQWSKTDSSLCFLSQIEKQSLGSSRVHPWIACALLSSFWHLVLCSPFY